MCVLLLHHRTSADWPVVLLANRDEYFDRPFEPPALRDERLGIVAPKDLRAGGTWIGINRAGLVSGVTNRPGEEVLAGAPSRGGLVVEALTAETAEEAIEWVRRKVSAAPYAGFHLLVADREHAFVLRHRGSSAPTPATAIDVRALPPGAHMLTNLHEPDEVPAPPDGMPHDGEPIEETLRRLERLATDDTPRLPRGHRILKREAHRGTVCSATIAIPADGSARPIFRFAAGAPDRVPFRSVF